MTSLVAMFYIINDFANSMYERWLQNDVAPIAIVLL